MFSRLSRRRRCSLRTYRGWFGGRVPLWDGECRAKLFATSWLISLRRGSSCLARALSGQISAKEGPLCQGAYLLITYPLAVAHVRGAKEAKIPGHCSRSAMTACELRATTTKYGLVPLTKIEDAACGCKGRHLAVLRWYDWSVRPQVPMGLNVSVAFRSGSFCSVGTRMNLNLPTKYILRTFLR